MVKIIDKIATLTSAKGVREVLNTINYTTKGVGVKYRVYEFKYKGFNFSFIKENCNEFILLNGNKLPFNTPYFKIRTIQIMGVYNG